MRFNGVRDARCLLFLFFLPLLLSACGAPRHWGPPADATSPEARAQSLLVNLAGLNPRVAEPLVTGFSAAALERAVVLVVNTGVEEAQWAEGLLTHRWWLLADPSTRLLGADGVSRVLSEVQRMNPTGGAVGEDRQKEIRDELGSAVAPGQGDGSGAEGTAGGVEEATREEGLPDQGRGSRAELEDAVRWVQFTQAWSSYYQAVDAGSSGSAGLSEGSDVALDQAVTMSLVRPDFLDRLAALMVEGMGS